MLGLRDEPPGRRGAGLLRQATSVGCGHEGIGPAGHQEHRSRGEVTDGIDRPDDGVALADASLGQTNRQWREREGGQMRASEVPEATTDDVVDGRERRLQHEGRDARVARPFQDGRSRP